MGRYFPMFVDISSYNIVVVGGGAIASRRVKTLTSFNDHVTVVAPELSGELADLAAAGTIRWKEKKYDREDILNADMVLACTDDGNVNRDIYVACRCLGIRVNNCSDCTQCDFYFPGVITDEETVIGVTAGGTDHRKAREVTEKIRGIL